MKLVRKILCAALSTAILAGALGGCNSGQDTAYLTVDGKQVKVPYVMELDKRKIPLSEYRYYFLTVKNQMDGGDASFWTSNADAEQQLLDQTLEYLRAQYAIQKLADDKKITMTSSDDAQAENEISSTVAGIGGESAYASALTEQNLTAELHRSFVRMQLLSEKLMESYFGEGAEYDTSEAAMRARIDSDYIRASHILISLDTDGTTANKEKASQALARAKAGEDFDALVAEYGEDPGMTDNKDGYYFTHGDMVEQFETAAYALEVGQISDIVETDYGYHIIKRLPMEESYITENLATLTQSYESRQFQQIIQEAAEKLEVSYGPQYKFINTNTVA